MSFLTPWFLLGAAAIAGPVLFHLMRQSVRERTRFSSLMFLRPTPQRATRRHRLEHLWLLLLRCLCLALLATGFARPFFTKDITPPGAANEGRQIVLLVDTSASMRRAGVWDAARARAEKYLAPAAPEDQVAVMVFDRQPRTLVSLAEWTAWAPDQRASLARQRLAAVTPGWMDTQLGVALTGAAATFAQDAANRQPFRSRELVLISDLQAGAQLDGLQGHDWPAGVRVTLERVDAQARATAGLEIQNPAGTDLGGESPVRVRVANDRASDREKFQLTWVSPKGAPLAGPPEDIYLPPGQTRVFATPALPAGTTAATLQLTGAEEDFDSRSYFAAPAVAHLAIAWLGAEAGNDPQAMRYYFQRVFPDTPARQVKIISPEGTAAVAPGWLEQAAFAVIPGRLAPEAATATHDWLASGRTALFIATDDQSAPTLAALTGGPAVNLVEATGDYALLGDIDFTHPLFAPFADPRFSDFTHIHFWKHRRLDPPPGAPARVLATFDDGSPALVQFPVGRGNLLVLMSGWNPADSQLALSSKFPPLMQTMLDWSGASTPLRYQFETGEAIPSPGAAGGAVVSWVKPDGTTVNLAAGTAFTDTGRPGIYTATAGGQPREFAVNLPLAESRVAPMSPDELARLGVPLLASPALPPARVRELQQHMQRAELENRQKLWRWLIAGVLVVMLAEIILSGWLVRRPLTTGGPA